MSRFHALSIGNYVYDAETELYYLRSRYFNSIRDRFLNSDIQLYSTDNHACHNLFTYCGNNSINNHDPNGLDALTIYTNGENDCIIPSVAYDEILEQIYWDVSHNSQPVFASPFVATKYDPDPYRRPNQKKQGRENKNKARGGSNWSPRNNKRNGKPSYPRKHTPGKDHRKYSIPLIIPLSIPRSATPRFILPLTVPYQKAF